LILNRIKPLIDENGRKDLKLILKKCLNYFYFENILIIFEKMI